MKILYFAWVRSYIGVSEEEVRVPEGIETVLDLMEWLCRRGGGYSRALSRPEVIRVAINQEFAGLGDMIREEDEVAFFPPITGG